MAPQNVSSGAAGASRTYGLILVLLTVVLSSASPLAVPSVALSHQNSNHRKQSEKLPPSTGQQQSHTQEQNGQRRVDTVSSIDLVRYWPGTPPDLYNITLSAMKQYIQSQLNLTGLGRGPRKRSHHFSDADIDFYKRIKEFNTTQSTIVSSSLANSDNASSVSNVAQSHDHFRPDMTMDVSELSDHDLQVDDPMASFERPVDHSNDLPTSNAVAGGQDRSELGSPSNAKDYNVLMDDPRGYITAHSSYPHRPAKTTTWDSAFIRHRGEFSTFS